MTKKQKIGNLKNKWRSNLNSKWKSLHYTYIRAAFYTFRNRLCIFSPLSCRCSDPPVARPTSASVTVCVLCASKATHTLCALYIAPEIYLFMSGSAAIFFFVFPLAFSRLEVTTLHKHYKKKIKNKTLTN